jgi:2-amino-4-hydroxy-6-hydroxymethyldihydropteridine diphosphokinase
MTRCYLGLGSNLRSPTRQLRKALVELRQLPRSVIVATSRIYSTKPWGMRGQPGYANMVIAIETKLPAQTVLTYCQQIEKKQHRVRKVRWGSRTLDIDLLLYGTQTIATPTLTIPHPRMLLRDFVLVPLLEIAPNVLNMI